MYMVSWGTRPRSLSLQAECSSNWTTRHNNRETMDDHSFIQIHTPSLVYENMDVNTSAVQIPYTRIERPRDPRPYTCLQYRFLWDSGRAVDKNVNLLCTCCCLAEKITTHLLCQRYRFNTYTQTLLHLGCTFTITRVLRVPHKNIIIMHRDVFNRPPHPEVAEIYMKISAWSAMG